MGVGGTFGIGQWSEPLAGQHAAGDQAGWNPWCPVTSRVHLKQSASHVADPGLG